MTFDDILTRMMDKIPDTYDKRVGSVIYLAIAPAAYELSKMYDELYSVDEESYIDMATGSKLTRRCSEGGVYRKSATKALRKGEFNIDITVGNRFGINGITYICTEILDDHAAKLECEQAGTIGNIEYGTLLPLNNIDGLTSATLTDILISGADEETDDELRARYQVFKVNPTHDGNVPQYYEWANEYENIGICKVFPLWNGGNTVKVAITDRYYLPASATLVSEFQKYMDPNSEGLGNGMAPIGAKVTITGGTKKEINVAGTVVLNAGYTSAEGAETAIKQYLASIVYNKSSVSYMRMGSTILDVPSISELSGLTMNNGTNDIELTGDDIPVLGTLTLTPQEA